MLIVDKGIAPVKVLQLTLQALYLLLVNAPQQHQLLVLKVEAAMPAQHNDKQGIEQQHSDSPLHHAVVTEEVPG